MPRRSLDKDDVVTFAAAFGSDRRRAKRAQATVRALLMHGEPAGTSHDVHVLDVAERGLKIGLRENPPSLGDRVEVMLECEVPLRVHLGFDMDSLIIDGPLHTHVVRFIGRVIRIDMARSGLHQVGLEIVPECDPDVRMVLRSYIDHITAEDGWAV